MARLDLAGQRFGKLTVLNFDHVDKSRMSCWKCKCDCGKEIVTRGSYLISGRKQSCGCMNKGKNVKDLSNKKFGRLLVICLDHISDSNITYWKCKCDCGKEIVTRGTNLTKGATKSCGCYKLEKLKKHGMKGTRLYHIWGGILSRTGHRKGCNEATKKLYMDSGIDVCGEWIDFENFKIWSLENGYRDDLEIDRIDGCKGYYPDNCRWVTHTENIRNRKCTLKLKDGTPFGEFLDKLGIFENNKKFKYWRYFWRNKKIHPELKQIMFETMD